MIQVIVQPRRHGMRFSVSEETQRQIAADLSRALAGITLPEECTFVVDRPTARQGVVRSGAWLGGKRYIEVAISGYRGHFCLRADLARGVEWRLKGWVAWRLYPRATSLLPPFVL